MAIFGFGKEKKDGSGCSELVLAYFEDAQRLRTVFTLIGPKKTELTATLQGIDEAAGLATFQTNGPLVADKGSKVRFVYIHEGLRLGGGACVTELRPNTVVLELPDTLEVMERRSQPRARLNPKEGATLTALTGIFDGVGITGTIENVSETGARIKVEKAMSLKGEKRLPLGTALVHPGQVFMLVKLNKLPKCQSVMELEGAAVYLENSAGGLAMGLRFEKPRAEFGSSLRSFVGSRATAIPATPPAKARRKAAEASSGNLNAEESLLPPARRSTLMQDEARALPMAAPAAAEAAAEPVREAIAEPSAALPLAPEPALPVMPEAALPAEPVALPAEPVALPKNDALVRLKKRSRGVVALVTSRASCDLLKEYLQEEGYGRVMVTSSEEEFMGFLQLPNLGLVLLDGEQSTLEALEFVRKLKDAFPNLAPVILAAELVSTSIVMAAHRSGVSQMLVKPYALDETLSELLTKQMGL